jgi:ABC-type lipoprotein release transport system permease subunit
MDEWIRAGTAATRFVFALIGLFALVALLLGLVAVIADVVPAWRATRVMPAAVLRNE